MTAQSTVWEDFGLALCLSILCAILMLLTKASDSNTRDLNQKVGTYGIPS